MEESEKMTEPNVFTNWLIIVCFLILFFLGLWISDKIEKVKK